MKESSKELIEFTDELISVNSTEIQNLTNRLFDNSSFEYLPKKFASDLVSMYYDKNYNMEKFNSNEQVWYYSLISKFNKTILKPFTNNNEKLNSIILPYYLKSLDKILYYAKELKDNQDKKDKKSDNNNSSKSKLNLGDLIQKPLEFDSNGNKNLEGHNLDNFVESVINEAENLINQELKELPDEIMNAGKTAGKQDVDLKLSETSLDIVYELYRKLKFNRNIINKIINKTISKAKNNFIIKNVKKESIFDSDTLDDLEDLYNIVLHPYFYKEIFAIDVTQSYGITLDVYFDISLSMKTNVKISTKESFFLPDILRYLCYCMSKNNLINDIYTFDTSINKTNIDSFLKHRFNGGGTDIEEVIKHIKNNTKNPSLIITDGEDSFRTYDDNVFILYVKESSFKALKNINHNCILQYKNKKKIMGFIKGEFLEL